MVVHDLPAAREAAAILVAAGGSGHPMTVADAQIAGICLAGGHHLAKRNVEDFVNNSGLIVTDLFAS